MPLHATRPRPARRRRLTLAALTAAAACWATACGGGDDDTAQPEQAEAAAPQRGVEGQRHAGAHAITPRFETPTERDRADMDDPAVWVHPDDRDGSLILAAAKEGGLRVFDFKGRLVQQLPAEVDAEGAPLNRYNNVEVVYGFKLGGGRVDLAIATDRLRDRLKVWRLDEDDEHDDDSPLGDVTSPRMPQLFPTRPDPAERAHGSVPNPDDGEHTAYGLAVYRDQASGRVYAFVNQNDEAVIAQYELVADRNHRVSARFVRDWRFPYVYKGQDLTQENEDDPARDFSPQFEGMVVDQRTGILYAGQEDVGIWRIDVRTGVAEDRPFYETHSFDPNSRMARDLEGLTIYYGADGSGYLLASSQGMAHGEPPTLPTPGLDDSFVVFERRAPNRLLGSFRIEANRAKGIDGVQESDGSDVSNVPLPGFPFGVLITQDGYDGDVFDGSVEATNLKLTPWEAIARHFPGGPLKVDTRYDPRRP